MGRRVTALVGAQYGSEGKGVVAATLASEYGYHVRTGGPNAGHSIVFKGKLYKMQSIPCGWVSSLSELVIGAGAVISPEILMREIEEIRQVDPDIMDRLYIDPRAGVLSKRHHDAEGGIDGELHKVIGSTGEGVGACRHDRMMRNPAHYQRFMDVAKKYGLEHNIRDTQSYLLAAIRAGGDVLLEGTQGSGLSLIFGPWPYVTSADTNAAQLAADAGIPPQLVTDVILVARTYPIRVAGNSGPLSNETSWEEMSRRIGRPVEERTTVTKKVRRVGEWDEGLMYRAVGLNDPKSIVLTFMDYMVPEDANKTKWGDLGFTAKQFVDYVEQTFDVPVSMVGTGFDPEKGWVYIDRRM